MRKRLKVTIGERFGKRVVTRVLPDVEQGGHQMVEVLCDCGETLKVIYTALVYGKAKSCLVTRSCNPIRYARAKEIEAITLERRAAYRARLAARREARTQAELTRRHQKLARGVTRSTAKRTAETYASILERLAAGENKSAILVSLGLTKQAISAYAKRHPDFKAAMVEAIAKGKLPK